MHDNTHMKAGEWMNFADRVILKGGIGIGRVLVCLLVTITNTATRAEANSKNLSTTSAKAYGWQFFAGALISGGGDAVFSTTFPGSEVSVYEAMCVFLVLSFLELSKCS